MTSPFSLLSSLLFLIIIVFSLIYFVITWPFGKKGEASKKIDIISGYLVLVAALVLIFSFYAVNTVLTDLKNHGDSLKELYASAASFGSLLSGVMLPFIGIATAIVGGLAFFMQYQANKQIRNQFKLQQFESQFYEMLRLHKENVNEMELLVYEEDEDKKVNFKKSNLVKGRKIFTYLQEEFHLILSKVSESNHKIFEDGFKEAYTIFFHGITDYQSLDDLHASVISDDFFKVNIIQQIYKYENSGLKKPFYASISKLKIIEIEAFQYDSLRNITEKLKYNIINDGIGANRRELKTYFNLFNGHYEQLGHYYRHLYMTVKFVVETYEEGSILKSKKECLKYLRILRGQLSNSEQIMLFYNWIAGGVEGYGAKWESEKYQRKYFSEYYMLHNLNCHGLFSNPYTFIFGKLKEIYDRASDKDALFEIPIDYVLKKLEENE